MKVSLAALAPLVLSALAAPAPEQAAQGLVDQQLYTLRVQSTIQDIAGKFITRSTFVPVPVDRFTSAQLGVYNDTAISVGPWRFSSVHNATADTYKLFTYYHGSRNLHAILNGLPGNLQFGDMRNPGSIRPPPPPGIAREWKNFKVAARPWGVGPKSSIQVLEYEGGQTVGGKGRWIACDGQYEKDGKYDVYWNDGATRFPFQNCEPVFLEIVQAGQ